MAKEMSGLVAITTVAITILNSTIFAQQPVETLNLNFKDGTSVAYNVATIDKMFFSEDTTIEDDIEFVDLGLSVKWAKWNLGAKSYNEKGDQYAWGETETKKRFLSTHYNYPYCLFPTSYDNSDLYIGGTLYDAASTILGNGARMPSLKDLSELISMCDIEEILENESDGTHMYYKFTGPSGKSIYIQRHDDFWLQDGVSTSNSRMMDLQASGYNDWRVNWVDEPYNGKYIRPVKEIQVEEYPYVAVNYEYGETYKSHYLNLEIDQSIIDKYKLTALPYGYSDLGFLYSSNPNILLNKKNFKVGNFHKSNGKYTTFDISDFKNGTIYYVVPYVVIGGVYYYGDEISFKAGSQLPSYKVGDYYPDRNNPIGIVCYVESEGTHGKIISLDETTCAWDFNWPQYQGASSSDNGSLNTKKITAVGAIAPGWCTDHGDGWYWPARFELTKFSDRITIINSSLRACGGQEINGLYWSSTEYGGTAEDLAYIVCLAEKSSMGYDSGWNNWTGKNNKHNVRAMKKF